MTKPQSTDSERAIDQNELTPILRWLWLTLGMIFCMVMIGGITRLTGSGLSMVEWRPLMGALPPLSDMEWSRVFELYQASPQYQEVNAWMTLADFKRIFFWEYLHRLFGRLIGLVFFIPWLYFTLKGHLKGHWRTRAFVALVLGGAQGLMGWYMVKSGLVDRPEVSHFRLAAHLSLAFLCGMWIWAMILDVYALRDAASGPPQDREETPGDALSPLILWAFIGILTLQIIYGAFMAGTRAGYLYDTFPTMNGSWLAPQWGALTPWWRDLLYNPDSVHFIHRTLAWVVLGWGVYLVKRCWSSPRLISNARWLLITLSLQFLLGVFTVLSGMNHALAAAHQGGAFLLLSATVALWLRGRD